MCNELQSNELLLSEPFSTDPANHCAPLLDHFTEQDATGTRFLGDVVFLVFPLALKARVLPCRVALHALDAVHQTLEVPSYPETHCTRSLTVARLAGVGLSSQPQHRTPVSNDLQTVVA